MIYNRRLKQWMFGVAGATLALSASPLAFAQNRDEPITTSEEIVVPGQITYRNRTDDAAPVLEYGLDYFQRFEPLTVGDALKRVPSVAFLSDVLESDGVRLRGLDPAYTQILINGEQVPGSGSGSGSFGNGSDGAFFVDRIPAELIESVEIVRSQSANRSGDALAGAINIVLRDSYSLEGGFVRGGVQYWEGDENWGESLGGVWGGAFAGGRLLIGANMQDRHNPKEKFSQRFDEPGGDLDNTEVQTDTRDGTDYSGNFSYEIEGANTAFGLDGLFVHTDRYENEDSIEYAGGVVSDATIETLNDNNTDIEQQSYSLNGRFAFEAFGGETTVKLGFASFTNEEFEFEEEASYDASFPDPEEFEAEVAFIDLTDEEFKAKLEHERELGGVQLEFGVHYEQKERDNLVTGADADTDVPAEFPDPLFNQGSLGSFIDPSDIEAVPGGDNTIERTRLDPYLMFSGEVGAVGWEAGLRYETTETTVNDRTEGVSIENNHEILLPSAHIKWNITEDGRILASVARTVRNPSFAFLSPATLEGELGDNDFFGNPELDPETAWGLDIGYEQRLGRTGVFGVNFFYRDVTDLIELFNTGAPSDEYCGDFEDDTGFTCDDVEAGVPAAVAAFDPDSFVFSTRNTGEGSVWGVEFDLSTPLTVFGLENTGVFINYSWLDSEVTDELGERRFNDQAESIFNIGFIHDIPSWAASFGATYRSQGDAFSRVIAEEVRTTYGEDLEIFVEKRFGERFTLRFTGSNLLDASKDEVFDKFDNLADQLDRDYDEFELETESAGPVFQLVGRVAF